MNILITGATGFVGRHIVLKLKDDEELNLTCVSRNRRGDEEGKIIWKKADILSEEGIKDIFSNDKFDCLIHLAWYVEHGKYWESHENIKWLFWSFELVKSFVKKGGKKVIVAGTCVEYDWTYGLLSEERTPLNSFSLYGISKSTLFMLVSHFCKQNNIKLIWPRIFFVFGPGEDRRRFIPSIINSLLTEGKAVCMNSKLLRDFIYVKDVAEIFHIIVKGDRISGPLNVGTGRPISLGEIAEKLEKLCGGKVEKNQVDEKYPIVLADISKLKTIKDKFVDIDQALEETVEFWRKSLGLV